MNEYDSNRIIDFVKLIGYEKTNNQIDADCCVLNTCHIRSKATEKVYSEIGRVKKNFKNIKKPLVIVAGCVAQAESEEMLKRDPYIDMVIGPQSYHEINDKILNYFRENKKINLTEFNVVKKFDELEKIKNSDSQISSFLTIQEGCDKFCNFCVVPYTRGPEYSRPFDQIINEAKKNYNKYKKNPATKTFQAIRIFVNQELTELILGLIEATKLLSNGGILIVVSFHSLEDKIIKSFGLSNRQSHFPSELSSGELQRIAISRALINKPEIILADEPTGSLDHSTAKEVFKIFYKLKSKNRLIIYATHNRLFANMADCKLEMIDGNIKSSNARK